MPSNGRLAGYAAMVSRMNLTDPSQKTKLAPCPCRLFAALRMSSGSLALTQHVPVALRESARMLTFMNPGSNAYELFVPRWQAQIAPMCRNGRPPSGLDRSAHSSVLLVPSTMSVMRVFVLKKQMLLLTG